MSAPPDPSDPSAPSSPSPLPTLDFSEDSTRTSARWTPTGDEALLAEYDARLSVALQPPISTDILRFHLEEAQKDGLDPKSLYAEAVRIEQLQWDRPTPAWEDVAPGTPTSGPSGPPSKPDA